MAPSKCWNKWLIARTVAGIFFPQRAALGFDSRECTPELVRVARHVVAETRSFERAAALLRRVLGHAPSAKTLERIAGQVSEELGRQLPRTAGDGGVLPPQQLQTNGLPHRPPRRPPDHERLMESLIKQINWRVKGTEMFWNSPAGAKAILQLRAASLSEDDRLDHYLTRRTTPTTATEADVDLNGGRNSHVTLCSRGRAGNQKAHLKRSANNKKDRITEQPTHNSF